MKLSFLDFWIGDGCLQKVSKSRSRYRSFVTCRWKNFDLLNVDCRCLGWEEEVAVVAVVELC